MPNNSNIRMLLSIATAAILMVNTPLAAEEYSIYFVPSTTNSLQQGFLRFTNPNLDPVSVTMVGIDDSGNSGQTTLTFDIGGLASQQYNSDDLEFGNEIKGLTGYLGVGNENWSLNITTTNDVGVSSYVRTSEGFLTKIGDVVPNTNKTSHVVPIFNPASNTNQVSVLRVVNLGNDVNDISILGIDDNGDISSTASISLAGNESVMLTSQNIENGTGGLSSGIGDGKGKWQLFVTTSQPAVLMNFLESPGGYLTNLSKPNN